MAEHRPQIVWCCPQLPPSPRQAMDMVEQLTAAWPQAGMAVIGSSLGGFYATVLAERRGCRAVVLNPAVNPARDLASHIGVQTSYHDPDLAFEFASAHVNELHSMTPPVLAKASRYAAVIAKGDELLDWREMQARYQGARILLLEGGDHALSQFGQ